MRLSERLFRLALRLAPRSFRERYEEEAVATHRERMQHAVHRGRHAATTFWGREVLGALWSGAQLTVDAWRGRGLRSPATGVAPGGGWSAGTLQDARFALRALHRSPTYAWTVVVVMAVGIGACTAIFSAFNAFFFRPLPFADPDRLVLLYETNPEFGWVDASAAPANALDWREQVPAFDDVAMYSDLVGRIVTQVNDEPAVLVSAQVSGNFFSVLGVRPQLGRAFTWEETWASEQPKVVLSHSAWQTHFGGDRGIIGGTIPIGTQRAEIIGVMPEGFSYPSAETQIWYPWGWARDAREAVFFRRAHYVRPIARLASGVSVAEANTQLQSVVRRLQTEYPATNSVMGAGLMPARDFLIRTVRRPMLILLGAVGLLLLLASANVANLTLIRGAERDREIAVRHALGAGRLRVARQFIVESVVLALIGGTLGVGIGWAGVHAMKALTPLGIDGATAVALDARVIAFALAATLASALLFGLAPAIGATAGRLQAKLVGGGTGASLGRRALRPVRAVVAIEVALSLLLLLAAGLMTRSFLLIRDVHPGFERAGVLAVQIPTPASRYPERDHVLAFQDRLLQALEGRPGIERVGLVAQLPLTGASWSSQLQARGWPPDRVGFEILHRRVNAGYFDAVGTPLLRGRLFGPADRADAPFVVVINETFAREHFPGEDPIGQHIAYDRQANENSTWYEIIGIVGDQHQVSPAQPARAEAFEHYTQDWARSHWYVLRTGSTDPMTVLPTVRAVLRELDAMIPITRVQTLEDAWRASVAREEFILTLLAVFGAVALLLSAVGVYGVTAQAAKRRTREIGIRLALGAGRGNVLALMLRQSLTVVAIGLVVGLAVSAVANRALASLLFGIAPGDVPTAVTVLLLLGSVAGLACYLPARRAMALDPVRSLKHE